MKKLLCVLLIVVSILFVYVSAQGIELNAQQKKELYDYGIMIGDENGDLRLDKTITRAEAVKMICVAAGVNTDVDAETGFTDVPKDNWAYKYIAAAKVNGIVDGDGDGTFNPDREITNEEAVKMIVSSLGYGEMANLTGGYPAGYTQTATKIGVTKGLALEVDTAASRNDVAVMMYNALDIPIMIPVGFEADSGEYAIAENNGKEITFRSILSE